MAPQLLFVPPHRVFQHIVSSHLDAPSLLVILLVSGYINRNGRDETLGASNEWGTSEKSSCFILFNYPFNFVCCIPEVAAALLYLLFLEVVHKRQNRKSLTATEQVYKKV